jgi:hypothetical protein
VSERCVCNAASHCHRPAKARSASSYWMTGRSSIPKCSSGPHRRLVRRAADLVGAGYATRAETTTAASVQVRPACKWSCWHSVPRPNEAKISPNSRR